MRETILDPIAIKVMSLTLGIMQTHCYIVSCNHKAVVIDPGASYRKIRAFLDENGLSVCAVLLTHGHFDHHGAAAQFQKGGAKIYFNPVDTPILKYKLGFFQRQFKPDVCIKDGDILEFGDGLSFRVIATPGHTAGGVCFQIENMVFTGDTLFEGVLGYHHLKSGNYNDLIDSVKNKLYTLPLDTLVYPGHGNSTTIKRERESNKGYSIES